jgi:hypothetical protein
VSGARASSTPSKLLSISGAANEIIQRAHFPVKQEKGPWFTPFLSRECNQLPNDLTTFTNVHPLSAVQRML